MTSVLKDQPVNVEWLELKNYLGGKFNPEWAKDPTSAVLREYARFKHLYGDNADEEFYKATETYVYDSVDYFVSRVKDPYHALIGHYLRELGTFPASILDFGCGAGCDGFKFMDKGHSVDFADVPNPSMEYLKWRLSQREVTESHVLDVREIFDHWPPPKVYDLVMAFDVLEHVPNPFALVRNLGRMGKMVAVNVALGGPSPLWPMHRHVDWHDIIQDISITFTVLSQMSYENCHPYPESRFLIFRSSR